jgi:hypothetical protein
MYVTTDCTSAPLVQCDKKLEYLTVATVAVKSANEATVVPMVGSGGFCFWREYGVWSQAVCFVLVRSKGGVLTLTLVYKGI